MMRRPTLTLPKDPTPDDVAQYASMLLIHLQTAADPFHDVLVKIAAVQPFLEQIDPALRHKLADAIERALSRGTVGVQSVVRALLSRTSQGD